MDGIHFDDYFYPYPEKDETGNKIEFPDDKNWNKYLKSFTRTSGSDGVPPIPLKRGDWRRKNVNDFIETVGREIKKIKPEILYGISPFGIWQPVPEMGITGLNSYAELYADASKMAARRQRRLSRAADLLGNGAARSIVSGFARLVETGKREKSSPLDGNRLVSHRLEPEFHRRRNRKSNKSHAKIAANARRDSFQLQITQLRFGRNSKIVERKRLRQRRDNSADRLDKDRKTARADCENHPRPKARPRRLDGTRHAKSVLVCNLRERQKRAGIIRFCRIHSKASRFPPREKSKRLLSRASIDWEMKVRIASDSAVLTRFSNACALPRVRE